MEEGSSPSPTDAGTDGVGSHRSVSVAIVEAVTAEADETVETLDPLNEVVDSDALDRLFEGEVPSGDGNSLRVAFPYAGFKVTVDSETGIDLDRFGGR